MKIHVTSTFLDGQRRFEKGDICTVSDEDGARFIDAKWAVPEGEGANAVTSTGPVDLVVQNGSHATSTVVGG